MVLVYLGNNNKISQTVWPKQWRSVFLCSGGKKPKIKVLEGWFLRQIFLLPSICSSKRKCSNSSSSSYKTQVLMDWGRTFMISLTSFTISKWSCSRDWAFTCEMKGNKIQPTAVALYLCQFCPDRNYECRFSYTYWLCNKAGPDNPPPASDTSSFTRQHNLSGKKS